MIFSRTILGFIISKEGKVMDPKKVEAFNIYASTYYPPTDPSFQWDGIVL